MFLIKISWTYFWIIDVCSAANFTCISTPNFIIFLHWAVFCFEIISFCSYNVHSIIVFVSFKFTLTILLAESFQTYEWPGILTFLCIPVVNMPLYIHKITGEFLLFDTIFPVCSIKMSVLNKEILFETSQSTLYFNPWVALSMSTQAKQHILTFCFTFYGIVGVMLYRFQNTQDFVFVVPCLLF